MPNDFNANYESFTGFALSTMSDTTTPGFTNQYSVISGSGAAGSSTYAVGFLFANNSIFFNEPTTIQSFDVNNTTFAALSMRDGDTYAKKFGGETGDDPDYFLLTITFLNNGEVTGDTIEFFMADFRFEDNTQDFILDEWSTIDLSSIENLYDEIQLNLSSTDVGAFGMNTPNYVAIDNFIIQPVNTIEEELQNVSIFPNPVYDVLNIELDNNAKIVIHNSVGQQMISKEISSNKSINLSQLEAGIYYIRIESKGKNTVKKFIKI